MKYTLSLCAAALLCSQPSLAEISDLGSFYSDIKLRYEHADIDDPADNDKADAALADIAVGFKSAEYAGFSVLAEYEAGVLALDDCVIIRLGAETADTCDAAGPGSGAPLREGRIVTVEHHQTV